MDSKQFYKVLNIVKHALYQNNFLPELGYFTLKEDSVSAYNDFISITYASGNLKLVEDPVMVKGDEFLKLIKNFSGDLSFKLKDEKLVISNKKTTVKVDVRELINIPTIDNKKELEVIVTDDWYEAIPLCLRSVGKNIEHPEEMGVLMTGGEEGQLYSTDNVSISRASWNYAVDDFEVLLPIKFCEIIKDLVSFIGEGASSFLYINQDSVHLEIDGEGYELVVSSKLSDRVDLPDYEKQFNSIYSNRAYANGIKFFINQETNAIVGRHAVEGISKIEIYDDMSITTKTDRYEIADDNISVVNDAEGEFEALIDFNLIKRFSDISESVTFTNKAAIMTRDNFINLIAYED